MEALAGIGKAVEESKKELKTRKNSMMS